MHPHPTLARSPRPTWSPPRRPARLPLVLLAGLAAAMSLTACRDGVVAGSATSTQNAGATDATGTAGSGTSGAATTPATSATTATTSAVVQKAGSGGAGQGGAGSLTLDIASPVTVAGHVDTPVTCTSAALHYAQSASGTVNGKTVTESVRIARYQGPGSYSAAVSVSVVAPEAGRYAITAVPAQVQVTSTGGSVSFSASTDGGRTLAGTITWSCS